jgi:mannose-6-phosphate isomerase-like protein (cupin superfamily)
MMPDRTTFSRPEWTLSGGDSGPYGSCTAAAVGSSELPSPNDTEQPRRNLMTYLGETGQVSGVLRTGVPPLQMNPATGTSTTFVAPGSVTRGEFGLFRWDMPALAGGAGAHFHRGFSESFYVISGTVGLYDGEAWAEVSEGGFFYVPPGGVHGFRNSSAAPASMLILFAPGVAREKYFEELAEIRAAGRTLTDEQRADLFARHDQVNL